MLLLQALACSSLLCDGSLFGLPTLVAYPLFFLIFSIVFYSQCLTPRKKLPGDLISGPRAEQYFHQTKEVRVERAVGETPVYRSFDAPEGELPSTLITPDKVKISTQFDVLQYAMKKYGTGYNCLGAREKLGEKYGKYVWKNYIEVGKLRDAFGDGLIYLGLKPGDRIGIYSKNRDEWVITEQAAYANSFVVVSLYDTLGPDAVEYISSHSGVRVVVCANESLSAMKEVMARVSTIEHVIYLDPLSDNDEKQCNSYKSKLIYFWDLLEDGRKRPLPESDRKSREPNADSLSTIMYTSGTTGAPKGVLLTHGNLIAMMAAANERVGATLVVPGDCYLSYLPLAHILERLITSMAILRGVGVGFYSGDVKRLIDDLAQLRPTLFCGVPRVYERIYDRVHEIINGGTPLRRFLFAKAMAASRRAMENDQEPPLLWSFLVLNKLKNVLGGKVRVCLSGGAPLNPTIHNFLRTAFRMAIVQAYGLTETCAGGTIGMPADTQGTIGHVGVPVACCELKLVDVPDMEYTSQDKPCPRGEILLKGPHVSSGYYKDPEKTKEEFQNGWFHTGDIGRLNEDGTISIIDRKKNIFKLSHGEYIAAEKLEGIYALGQLSAQVWVYGDSNKNWLVAVVSPRRPALEKKAKQMGIRYGGYDELLENEEVKKAVLKDLNDIGSKNKIRGFERVFAVHLFPDEFNVENDLQTPTLKMKRHNLYKRFQTDIEAMYEALERNPPRGPA